MCNYEIDYFIFIVHIILYNMNYQLNNFVATSQKCEVFPHKMIIGFSIYANSKDKSAYEKVYNQTKCISCAIRTNIIKNICGADGPIYDSNMKCWEMLYSKVYEHKNPPYKLIVNKSIDCAKNDIYNCIENKRKHNYCKPFYETDKKIDPDIIQKILNKYVQLYWNLIRDLHDKLFIIREIKFVLLKEQINYSKKVIESIEWFEKNINEDILDLPVIDFYDKLGKMILGEKIIDIGIDCFEPYIKNFFILNNYIKKFVTNYKNYDDLYDTIIYTDFSSNSRLKNPNSQKYLKLAIDKFKNFKTIIHTDKELEQLGACKINNKTVELALNEMLNANKENKKIRINSVSDLIDCINTNKIYKLKLKTYKNSFIYTAKYTNCSELFKVNHLWSVLDNTIDGKVYEITHIYKYDDEDYKYFMFKTKDNLIKNFEQCLHPEFLHIKWESKFSNILRKLNTMTNVEMPNTPNISSGFLASIDSLNNNLLENVIEIQINDSKKWLSIDKV